MVDPRVRHRRRRRRLMISLTVLILIIVGTGASAFAYLKDINDKLHPPVAIGKDPDLSLTQANTSIVAKPFYMVLIGVDIRPEEKVARSDTLVVARVDPVGKRVQMMSILRDTRVTIPGRGKAKVNEAMQRGGPGLVIDTVKDLTGLPISHWAVVNFEGFKSIVDAMGGVTVNVPVAIDDIQAASNHPDAARIPEGLQKLDGQHALTFVRARHQFADQDFSRVRNQQLFIKALYKQAMGISNPATLLMLVNAVAGSIQTDMSVLDLASLARVFKGMPERNIESITLPGESKFIGGVSYVVADEAAMSKILSRMQQGYPLTGAEPTSTVSPMAGIEPSGITVTVRNGAGVSGLAKGAQDKLVADGFKITETGNMNQFVYGRTLVVYKTEDKKAGMVRESLGIGDVIAARGMYSFNSDVMVVVGKDWDPKKLGATGSTIRR
jgi:LCP family protein required for cell wall assembly